MPDNWPRYGPITPTDPIVPKFRHDTDCGRETFVGHFQGKDIYWCDGVSPGQWIVRTGDNGEDYESSQGMTLDRLLHLSHNLKGN